jgi:Cu2+-exporting ATPase
MERGIAVPHPSSVRNITGDGIIAGVEGQEIRIVSPGHLARQGQNICAQPCGRS